jgi:tRNA (uracil-5-)-methyltransferase
MMAEENNSSAEDLTTQRVGFSSENFKIEIQNLPKFFGVGQARKLLTKKLGLKPHKLKPCGKGASYMFVNFVNEEDRDQAVDKLDGYKIKGNPLKAFKAKAAKDPMIKMAAKEESKNGNNVVVDTRPVNEQIMSAVCPHAQLAYEDQLKAKKTIVEEILAKMRKEFMKQNGFFKSHGISEDGLAELSDFIQSPILDGYRNKCEFTVGRHPETNEATVGFRLASYKKGSIAVVGIDHLPVVSDTMKKVVNLFQTFVRASKYEPFDNVTQKGFWKQLTVRHSSRTGDLLVWAILNPQDLTDEDQDQIKTDFKAHFDASEVTSLHIQFFGQRTKNVQDPAVLCLKGHPYIKEKLMGLTFNVSPKAFFQINTEAAEKLYETCGQIANLDEKTVLFDVCCGTGTIGLCLASKVKAVHGVDVVIEAVKNATANAEANGITNATFITGTYMLLGL